MYCHRWRRRRHSCLKGASAVIEKDLVSGRLADLTDADLLMILTNEEFVNIHYDSDSPLPLKHMTPAEALSHIENQEFGKNKMLPKIEASMNFVSQKAGRKAIITSIDKAKDAYLGKTGTVISQETV